MTDSNLDPEIAAISTVHGALQGLDPAAQRRVLDYVTQKLGLKPATTSQAEGAATTIPERGDTSRIPQQDDQSTHPPDDQDGINPVAQRWIRRAGISPSDLGLIFSIGGEDIDLVTQSVPGESKKERLRSILLLKAMASYLASGAPRATHQAVKEAATHYDAWDVANFATYLKSFSSEIGGSKGTGYSLNARGLSSATELIKTMIANVKK